MSQRYKKRKAKSHQKREDQLIAKSILIVISMPTIKTDIHFEHNSPLPLKYAHKPPIKCTTSRPQFKILLADLTQNHDNILYFLKNFAIFHG